MDICAISIFVVYAFESWRQKGRFPACERRVGDTVMVTDPIANMLTSIRNAQSARKETVRVPYSALKHRLAEVLRSAGYLGPVTVVGEAPRKYLEAMLLYRSTGEAFVHGIRRVSTPGRRWYVRTAELSKVLSGHGIAVISTSKGLLTDSEARKYGVGGEIVCEVW